MQREGALDITRKILKRLDKRLGIVGQFKVCHVLLLGLHFI